MRIYIDESGCFTTKIADVSVMATVMYPESLDYKIEKFFNKFYKTLEKEEKDAQGEVKGFALSENSLKRVFQFISKNKDIKITFDVFDAEIHTPAMIDEFRRGQAVEFQESLDRYMKGPVKAETMKQDLLRLKGWSGSKKKISDQDYLQIVLLTKQLEETIQKAIVYYSNKKYARAFKAFEFVFDNKSSKKMLNYINDVMPSFLATKSSGRGMVEIEGTVYKGHPLEKYLCKVDGMDGYDIGKIFSKGIKYGDSKKYFGLQLADIIVSNIRAILLGRRNMNLFDLIRFNCAYFIDKWRPFRLFILNTKQKSPTKSLSRKEIYEFLQKPAPRGWHKVLKPGFD
ncbi:MAG: DUF3800 domain-containing protein [Nitrospirota bacterium]